MKELKGKYYSDSEKGIKDLKKLEICKYSTVIYQNFQKIMSKQLTIHFEKNYLNFSVVSEKDVVFKTVFTYVREMGKTLRLTAGFLCVTY